MIHILLYQMWAIGNTLRTLSRLFTGSAQTHLSLEQHLEPIGNQDNELMNIKAFVEFQLGACQWLLGLILRFLNSDVNTLQISFC